MGIIIFILAVVLLICWSTKKEKDEIRGRDKKYKEYKERRDGLIDSTLMDSNHKMYRINDYEINRLLRGKNMEELTKEELENYVHECEIWRSHDGKVLCINPLGIHRPIAIDCDKIINISCKIVEHEDEEEIIDLNFDKPKSKSGFDVGGAVLGTLIAGTPGTIIGGMHNMGKESTHEYPRTRMVTNFFVFYHLNYIDNNDKEHRLSIDSSQAESWKEMFPDKWDIL